MSVELTSEEVRLYVQARIEKSRVTGQEFRSPCPIHKGTRESFAVNRHTGAWCCHSECNRGGDLILLEMALTGCEFKTALESISTIIGRDLHEPAKHSTADRCQLVAEYDYVDEHGALLFQVCRFEPKTFRPRRPDSRGGWQWGYGNVRRVLYRLPELLEASIVFVVEGERDVETLRRHGFAATTNAGGAKSWRDEFNVFFRGRDVVIIPDNDPPGWARARQIAIGVLPFASAVRILELEDAKDISEWFEQGHSEIELISALEVTCHA